MSQKKWSKLTDMDKRYIHKHYIENIDQNHEDRQNYLAEKFGVSKRTIRRWLNWMNITNKQNSLYDNVQFYNATMRRVERAKTYFVCWEQNATPIHEGLWRNMMAYADKLEAQPIVVLGRYQNPTSIWRDKIYNEGWSTTTEPYQFASRITLHKNLEILADLRVRPTAVNPLSGLANITGPKSGIIAHPKFHLETLPILRGYHEKILATSGSITIPNYTDSKSGVKGESKHKLGFSIVEIKDEDHFYFRQVEAEDDGSFYDLYSRVENGKIYKNKSLLGVVFGDTHVGEHDPIVKEVNDKLLSLFEVDNFVFHDIADGRSVSSYAERDPLEKYKRYKEGGHCIYTELSELKEFLESFNVEGNKYVVRSNHDDRFDRYISSADWKKDITNAEAYMEIARVLLSGDAPNGYIPFFIENHVVGNYTCLSRNESLRIGKYEVGQHGDIGLSGKRGSKNSYNKIDLPMIMAHLHTTFRRDDLIWVGTNTRKYLSYVRGPSDWSQSNAIIHPNGVAQQLIISDGDYTIQ